VLRVGGPDRERGGERVGDVVVAQQRQLRARQQRGAVEHERVPRAVEVAGAAASRSENVSVSPGSASRPTLPCSASTSASSPLSTQRDSARALANSRALSP
jgi:hypothetical protein